MNYDTKICVNLISSVRLVLAQRDFAYREEKSFGKLDSIFLTQQLRVFSEGTQNRQVEKFLYSYIEFVRDRNNSFRILPQVVETLVEKLFHRINLEYRFLVFKFDTMKENTPYTLKIISKLYTFVSATALVC